MCNKTKEVSGCDGPGEALLRSEIKFWHELIDSLNLENASAEALERMHQALALAQYRLDKLLDEEFSESQSTTSPVRKRRFN
ncbi:MAG TPA: hypothetical protein VKN35_03925 [Xanthomonadales bacterium]|nr:hypothetical protein [Xanthomonadales bacterium]